ncbi:MAG: hypothetical protein JXB10_09585 [Pirellulales bacterium]|nr:hypothetical protein [Pirellulales bacterium]
MPLPQKFSRNAATDGLFKREIKRRRLVKKHRQKSARTAAKKRKPTLDPPHWLPPGYQWDSLPHPLQTALLDIVVPAYNQLVAQVSDHLARSAGLSLVGLLWQEIVNQYDQGEQFVADPFVRSLGNYPELLNRQLQLIDAKAKTSYILVRLREAQPESRSGILPLPNHTPLPNPENSRNGILPLPSPTLPVENCPIDIPVDQLPNPQSLIPNP